MKRVRTHLALFGTTSVERAYCHECAAHAFVISGELKCCGARVEAESSAKRVRVCEPIYQRKSPPLKEQKRILEEQDYRCLYCDHRFGTSLLRGSKRIRLRLTWDHLVPFAYSQDNRQSNFAAACHVCNGIKSAHMFGSIDDAKVHIAAQREAKGYRELCHLPIELRPETGVAEVLPA